MAENDQDVAFLCSQLEQQRVNLRLLRGQQTHYGSGEERVNLLNQILAAEAAIREAKANLRRLGVEPERSLIDPSEEFKPFDDRVVKSYPYPLAQACADFNQPRKTGGIFVAADSLIVHLIKYLAAIFIGQARHDKPSEYPLPERLHWIANPTLESWTDALCELTQLYQHTPRQEKTHSPQLLDACTRPLLEKPQLVEAIDYLTLQLDKSPIEEPSVMDFLRLMAWYREREWGDAAGDYPLEKAEPLLVRLQPALAVVLNELEPLRRLPLVYVERADVVGSEVRLRLVKFMGLFTDEVPPARQPPIVVLQATAQHIRRGRFYLADAQHLPQLTLHPFIVSYHWVVHFLDRNAHNTFVEYRPCSGGKRLQPPPEAKTYYFTWWQEQEQQQPELAEQPLAEQPPPEPQEPGAVVDDMLPVLGEDDEHWENNVNQVASPDASEPLPLTCLSAEGREVLEIALGEALRIDRFWLGVEFLLMGLSKQDGCVFPRVLREIRLDPGDVRGALRGFAGVAASQKQKWRQIDNVALQVLGAEALPRTPVVDPQTLRQILATGREPTPVMTPRLQAVLQEAARLAGKDQVGHNHLLLAALKSHSLAATMLFSTIAEAGVSPEQLLQRIVKVAGADPEAIAGEQHDSPGDLSPESPHNPPLGAAPPRGRPRPARDSMLAQFGRDLTEAARDGKLSPAHGHTAHEAMVQLGRILLQREANNPILLGDPGVGKTAVVEGLAWRLTGLGREVMERLAGKRIVELSTSALMASTQYRGDLEQRLQRLLAEVQAAQGQTIVFIDEIHSILSGGASGGLSSIADALKPALARGEFPCIGATTVAEYRRHIEKDQALARRFTPVWLEEAGIEESLEIVQSVATERLLKHHGVTFPPETIRAAVELSARYLHEERLPGKAIKVLDQAASGVILGGSLFGPAQPPQANVEDRARIAIGSVTVEAVFEVIAKSTNIPVRQLSRTDNQRLLELENRLKTRVKGQDEAIAEVTRVIKRAGAGLSDLRRPRGVFLFAGPTGVGKTELALAVAQALFDEEDAIFRLDMSEFMEKHQVARLIGAPPGYVGFEEEGQLTGHLRRRPYSVILLDEMEKAHQDVQHLFLQLFDAGRLTDAHGHLADGRHAIFIMTTNLGAKESIGLRAEPYRQKLETAIREHFSQEFLNRLDHIVYFEPLGEAALAAVLERELAAATQRLTEQNIMAFITDAARDHVIVQGHDPLQGARPLRRAIERLIMDRITDLIIAGKLQAGDHIWIDFKDGQLAFEVRQHFKISGGIA